MARDSRRRVWGILVAGALLGAAAPLATRAADDTVGIVVVKEHGVGSQALAQPYLDKFVAIAADLNGWKHAEGQYFASRTAAEPYVGGRKPHYGILGLPALLALRTHYDLTII